MTQPRRIRWYGKPDDTQPDVGDVLVYQGGTTHDREWYHLVRGATQVRGRGPEHLWLTVDRYDLSADGVCPAEVYFATLDPETTLYNAYRRRPE